jgi:endonuclease-3
MILLSTEEIQEIIKPCGLSGAKSKAIHALSKILVEKYGGKVPDSLEKLKELPGVGHKTASVVVIQGFQQIAFPVDTHIHRLAQRWKLSNGKSVTETEKDLKAFFPETLWAKLHLQMIYFARAYCPAKGHKAELCPLCSHFNM